MKAAVYYDVDDIRIEDVPTPRIGVDEMLVEMKACGVCGSDLMAWYLRDRTPLVLGHEPAGVVIKKGEKVKEFDVGDRVFVHHHVACLTCYYCRSGAYTLCEQFGRTHIEPGGFAECFKVPYPNLQMDTLKIPDELTFEEATLIEPVACCIRALTKCNIKIGDTVAVIGAGPSGIIHVMLSRMFGANQIIVSDFIDYRLKAAKRFGADLTVNPQKEDFLSEVKETTRGRGVDKVIVTAPNVNAFISGMNIIRKGGTLCVFAPTPPGIHVKISPHKLFFSEIKIVPSYSTSHIETQKALELIRTKRIKVKELITHRFPLTHVKEAFKVAAKNKECLKVMVLGEE